MNYPGVVCLLHGNPDQCRSRVRHSHWSSHAQRELTLLTGNFSQV